jgi:ribonuclease VapC
MVRAVLDASAFLALILGEKGADHVAAIVGESMISAVNLAEVVSKLVDRDPDRPKLAWDRAREFPVQIMPYDEILARRTGELRALTRAAGLSLGDRACLALAEREGLPAVTADRSWTGLDIKTQIEVIR